MVSNQSQLIKFSIIIPAKNEEKRLPAFLESIATFCNHDSNQYEIIVVDDGSTDNTSAVALQFNHKIKNLNVLRLEINRGKGYAVKHGFTHAKGEIVLFIDADGSTPIDELQHHKHLFEQHADIVIGSRVIPSPHCKVEALAYRRGMGAIFNLLVSTFLIKGIKDTQCGFKMFRKDIIPPLWSKVQIHGFGFDLEVLFLAQRLGYKIHEVPVNWKHIDGSKIHPVKDSLRMLQNIFQIRKIHRHTK